MKITGKQFEKYRTIQKNCDHSKLTENTGTANCCFCTKLMLVLSANAGIDLTEFGIQFGDYMNNWFMKQPGYIENFKRTYAQMKKAGVI